MRQTRPRAIAVDADNLYWANIGEAGNFLADGTVLKTPLANRVAVGRGQELPPQGPTLVAAEQPPPTNLAVDATHIYWTALDDTGVMKAPISGGAPVSIMDVRATGLALGPSSVYLTTAEGDVLDVPLDGSNPIVLAAGQDRPSGIVIEGQFAFWLSGSGDVLMRLALTGGEPETLATGLTRDPGGGASDLLVDDSHVYWISGDQNLGMLGTIMRLPLSGGAPETFVEGQTQVTDIATDGAALYWTTEVGSVMKQALVGGSPETLAEREPAYEIAASDTELYWTSTSTVLGIAK